MGYENILDSQNEDLSDDFLGSCNFRIEDCIGEPDRMFTEDVGPICSDYCLARCDCGTKEVGDIWYKEYSDNYDREGIISCSKCECEAGSIADCDYPDISYAVGNGQCPEPTISCHDDSGTIATVGTLNAVNS